MKAEIRKKLANPGAVPRQRESQEYLDAIARLKAARREYWRLVLAPPAPPTLSKRKPRPAEVPTRRWPKYHERPE